MDLLGSDKPRAFDNTTVKVTDIGERMWPHLGPKARRLLNTGISNAAIQFDRGADGKIYQLKPIWVKQDDRPEQEYTREVRIMMALAKMVKLDEVTDEVPDEWIRRFALVVDKLVEDGRINYGVLGPPMSMPLAMAEVKHRILLMLYCFSDFDRDELNEWLGNEAFIPEGGIGNDDWTGLPE